MSHHSIGQISVAGLALAALCACSALPSTRYYTLLAPVEGASAVHDDVLIEVLPVRVPAQVDVQSLVVRQGAGELAPVEGAHWIAPLPDEWRSALSAQLQQLLGARDVYGLPQAADAPVQQLRVVLQRFDAWPGHRVDVTALWSLVGVGGARITCESRISERVGGDYSSLVQGYQRAVSAIAVQIASVARAQRSAPESAVSCPQ